MVNERPTPAMKQALRRAIRDHTGGRVWIDEEICGMFLEKVFIAEINSSCDRSDIANRQ